MTRKFKSVLSMAMTAVMAFSLFAAPASALELDKTHNEKNSADMKPETQVYAIGDESFYKINDDGVIVFGDEQGVEGFKAIPSAYIKGSEHFVGEGEGFAMYALKVGAEWKIHIVPMSMCFEDDIDGDGNMDGLFFDHGTAASATVSVEVDTATNEDPSMSTQFYIYIENGIDPDGITTEEVHKGVASTDVRVSYEITVETKGTYQVKATVPMYVCMYGYRGTGNIVTPTSDAYWLKNYSTQNATTEGKIVDITKLTQFTKLYDADHSDEEIYSIAFTADGLNGEGTYTWWYSDPSDDVNFDKNAYTAYAVIKGKDVNASGEVYAIYEAATDEWSFAPVGLLDEGAYRETVAAIDPNYPLAVPFQHGNWIFGTEFAVGDGPESKEDENMQEVVGMALRVTELQAEPATWRMVDADTHGVDNMLRGELAMTLAPVAAKVDKSAIDLADCSAPLDITERGWYLDAPTVNNGETEVAEGNETTLGLITKALMAGGNVNAEGCTPVVKVTYTVTPVFNAEDVVTSFQYSN